MIEVVGIRNTQGQRKWQPTMGPQSGLEDGWICPGGGRGVKRSGVAGSAWWANWERVKAGEGDSEGAAGAMDAPKARW
jgi:hypothetical protein